MKLSDLEEKLRSVKKVVEKHHEYAPVLTDLIEWAERERVVNGDREL